MNIQEYIKSGVIELYVMGLCNEEESQELESMRKQHPSVNDAILEFEAELETKMQQSTTLTSAETDEKILASLDALNVKSSPMQAVKNTGKYIKIRSFIAAAAAIILVVGGYFIFSFNSKVKKLENELAVAKSTPATLPLEDYKIMLDPKITPVAMYGVGTHAICRCTMFWDKKTGKLYIIIHHLPQSSSSKDYQLWAMIDNKPVNVGIIKDEIRGRFIEMENVPAKATSFIVTLEKAGGNASPTIEETYLSGRI